MSVVTGTTQLSENVLARLAAEFDTPPEATRAIVELLTRGAPAQFIAHYRRDETGDVGEDRVLEIEERWAHLQGLESRKETILQQARERGTPTDELEKTLADCHDQDLLDDLYQSFRPRRRTAGMQAEEKGLGPLALAIEFRTLDKPLQEAAQEYVNEELTDTEAVVEGALLILAEKYAANPMLRARIRDELSRGILRASATAPDRKGAQQYKEFFALEEPLRRITAARMLALRRAEREGIISVALCLPEGRELEIFREQFAADLGEDAPLRAFLDLAFKHAYEQIVRPACEADIRRHSKEKADRETVRNVARTLRAQLLAPPLGPKKVMALRATRRSIWAVILDEDGSVAQHRTLHIGNDKDGAQPSEAAATEKAATPGEETAENAAPPPPPEPAASEPSEATGSAVEEAPATEAPAATPAVDPPAADTPAVDTPAVEAPAADTPAVDPAAQTPPTGDPASGDAATGATPVAESTTDEPGDGAEAATPDPTNAQATAGSEAPATTERVKAAKKSRKTSAKTTPSLSREEAVRQLAELIDSEQPAALCIPHGRRQEASVALADDVLNAVTGTRPSLVPIDEAASAIHATSPTGRKALPGQEVGIRTAISLGRRLQDPMLELLTMDLRSLGLGQSLGEVHQGLLQRQLDSAIASCVGFVGLDVNRGTPSLLAHVPGIDKELAKRIFDFRTKAGGLRSLAALSEVEGIDADRFSFIAPFLRLQGGDEPLDATAVHPECYDVVRRIAADQNVAVTELFGRNLRQVEVGPLTADGLGRLRVLDVLGILSNVGRDPRGVLDTFRNEDLRSFADLKVDQELRGRVTNLTDFGAFIDLGIGQDGLVHISQIPPNRLHDTRHALSVGEVITVYVVHVEPKGKRISLTMRKPRHLAEGRRATLGERSGTGGNRNRRGRKERAPQEVMSRAARAPEGRRGDRRGGPRSAEGGEGGRRPGGRSPGGRTGGGRGRGPSGPPRVITVESSKPIEENRGHKGELRSLSGLRGLLGGGKESDAGADSGGETKATE